MIWFIYSHCVFYICTAPRMDYFFDSNNFIYKYNSDAKKLHTGKDKICLSEQEQLVFVCLSWQNSFISPSCFSFWSSSLKNKQSIYYWHARVFRSLVFDEINTWLLADSLPDTLRSIETTSYQIIYLLFFTKINSKLIRTIKKRLKIIRRRKTFIFQKLFHRPTDHLILIFQFV